MKHSIFSTSRSALFVLTLAAFLPACGGSQPAEPAAPPPAPAAPPPAPPPAPVAAAPAPEPAAAAPAPAPAEAKEEHHEMHHGMHAMFKAGLTELTLKPEQKATIDAAVAELDKLEAAHKDADKQLMSDVADGVAAGKIDHKKTDADVNAMVKAMQANTKTLQDNITKIHDALEPAQRKQLIDSVRAKSDARKAHMEEEMAEHDEHGAKDEHGMGMKDEHGDHKPGDKPGEGHGPSEHGMGMKDDHKPGEGHGPGEHGGMHDEHGMHGGHGMMMMKLADELALTPEQREKLKTTMEAEMKTRRAAMKAKMDEMEKRFKTMSDAFLADKFDAKKAGLGQKGPEDAKTMATMKIKMVENVLAILTPEQRTKFAAHVKEHADDMGE